MTASSSLPFALCRRYDCLRADVSYFLNRRRLQATAMMDHDA